MAQQRSSSSVASSAAKHRTLAAAAADPEGWTISSGNRQRQLYSFLHQERGANKVSFSFFKLLLFFPILSSFSFFSFFFFFSGEEAF